MVDFVLFTQVVETLTQRGQGRGGRGGPATNHVKTPATVASVQIFSNSLRSDSSTRLALFNVSLSMSSSIIGYSTMVPASYMSRKFCSEPEPHSPLHNALDLVSANEQNVIYVRDNYSTVYTVHAHTSLSVLSLIRLKLLKPKWITV